MKYLTCECVRGFRLPIYVVGCQGDEASDRVYLEKVVCNTIWDHVLQLTIVTWKLQWY